MSEREYATSLVNSDVFSDTDWSGYHFDSLHDFGNYLENTFWEVVTDFDSRPLDGILLQIVLNFSHDVDWSELAEMYASDNPEMIGEWETCDDCGERFNEEEPSGNYESILDTGYCVQCAARNE